MFPVILKNWSELLNLSVHKRHLSRIQFVKCLVRSQRPFLVISLQSNMVQPEGFDRPLFCLWCLVLLWLPGILIHSAVNNPLDNMFAFFLQAAIFSELNKPGHVPSPKYVYCRAGGKLANSMYGNPSDSLLLCTPSHTLQFV